MSSRGSSGGVPEQAAIGAAQKLFDALPSGQAAVILDALSRPDEFPGLVGQMAESIFRVMNDYEVPESDTTPGLFPEELPVANGHATTKVATNGAATTKSN